MSVICLPWEIKEKKKGDKMTLKPVIKPRCRELIQEAITVSQYAFICHLLLVSSNKLIGYNFFIHHDSARENLQ